MAYSKFVWLGAALAIGMAGRAEAMRFENSYVSFDLPDDWTCAPEGTEWVCKPPANAAGKVSMVAILTAKYVGDGDSPQLYIQHLKDVGKSSGIVMVKAPKSRLIGQAIWLDASLMNSEIRGYETRYLARTEGSVGILLTFSAHTSVAARAKPISDAFADSIEVNSASVRPELQTPQAASADPTGAH